MSKPVWISRRVYEQIQCFDLRFVKLTDNREHPLESFYGFSATSDGIPIEPFNKESYGLACDKSVYHEPILVPWTRKLTTPGVIECEHCRTHVTLDHHMTNTCDRCGVDYNMSGQRLAPREQWGEETGETYSDISRPFDSREDW